MPVSTSIHITHCLGHILTLSPKSVLDVGCGFGLWGFLCREYLDVFNERLTPGEWQVRIDGIELFEPYIFPHQRFLYNEVKIADIREAAPGIDSYDLIIAGDVIEHLEKSEGLTVLRHLYSKARQALLVNIPIGSGWDHGVVHDNPGELHRSQWEPEDFAEFGAEATLFELPCGHYGSFLCRRDLAEPTSDALFGDPDVESDEAVLGRLEPLNRSNPGHPETALELANTLLRLKRIDEALEVLEKAGAANPAFHYALIAAARLLEVLGKPAEARAHIETLAARPDIPADLRQQVEALLSRLAKA